MKESLNFSPPSLSAIDGRGRSELLWFSHGLGSEKLRKTCAGSRVYLGF